MAFARLLLIVLSIEAFLVETLLTPQHETIRRQFFEMDTRKLQDFWHTAIVRGVIKAHSKQLIKRLSHLEQVVYELCISNAKTTVALAKCAVRVFDARDAERERLSNSLRTTPTSILSPSSNEHPNEHLYSTGSVTVDANQHSMFYYKTFKRRRLNRIRRPTRYRRAAEEKLLTAMGKNRGMSLQSSGAAFAYDTSLAKDPPLSRPALDVKEILSTYLRKLLLGSKATSHLDKLRRIHDHFRRVDKCNEFFTQMNEHNRR